MNPTLIGRELLASLVVFLVALPLCIGIAVACDVPPAMGLVSGIIGGVVVGMLAGSPLQVSGPAAGLVVICVDAIHEYGLEALGPMILVAGLIQVAAGFTGVANWFRAVAPSVIYAMLFGIGVLIFAAQFHVMVDDQPQATGLMNVITIPCAIYKGLLGETQGLCPTMTDEAVQAAHNPQHILAARIGALTLVVLVSWNWVRTKLPSALALVPGPLLAIIAAAAAAYAWKLDIAYMTAPDQLFTLPERSSWAVLLTPGAIGTAFAIALIASAESLLCASAVDKLHSGARTNYDKELRAQGVGNLLSGLLGGLPITGVIVRSSANVEAGGTTRWSGVLHGVWLLLALMLVPWALAYIPKSALAAILVYIGWKLMNWKVVSELRKKGRVELAIFAVTVVLIVLLNLLEGLIIGLVLSVLYLAWMLSHLEVRRSERRIDGRVIVDLELRGTATFVGLPTLAEELERTPADSEIHVHLEHLNYVDHACLELLSDWEKQLQASGGKLVIEWHELVSRGQRPVMTPTPSTVRATDP